MRKNSFGSSLKKYRETNGLTLQDFCEQVGENIAYIKDIEQGRVAPPDPDVIVQFECVLGITDSGLQFIAQQNRD